MYCSNACQRAAERRRNVERWLATGEAECVVGKPRHYVRMYLIEEQMHVCAICGSPDDWMGMPLVFVIDHIDGDASNNCRDNLRLICPNCDSQLPSFEARNRGKGRAWRRERYAAGKPYQDAEGRTLRP